MTTQATAPDPTELGMGEVLAPQDAGYADASRAVFATGTTDLIVRPRDAGEVAAAVRQASYAGLALTVRSGGHSMAGLSSHHEGMLIDLSALDRVEVLNEDWLVRIEGGATWGQVADELRGHGLGITAGDTASVGVGGLLLGGGIGWMARRYGLAIDSLVAAEVVTADGDLVRTTAESHPDLFWALQGGGGNFGVVVAFEVIAQAVTDVHFGTITLELDNVARIVTDWSEAMRDSDERLTSTLMMLPPMMGRPALANVAVCFASADAAAADAALQPLRALGTVLDDDVSVRPYADVLVEESQPEGVQMLVRNTFVREVNDDVVAALHESFGQGPTAFILRSLGGAVGRVRPDETAFAHRDAEALLVTGTMLPVGAPAQLRDEAMAFWPALAELGEGAYVGFLGSATPEDTAAAYPPATYERLAKIKGAYDPGNVFCRNHNIEPSR
ncbi:FAD-binding oxidoreductase [Luteipulveratus mongoliensis]|uniref:FAD-binding PCMH-type domain-containing protein n=1 Tax=Luteipulveratus mongoliensis TaxID=571913 RepID=A0A0K1JHU1_9MICO|nr:FAD-binding oxidoreductase [Luteipulveratus mongoliensis]AKU16266.1 hypothetical protein VV02_10990 [Luteipulveratus mongoliensis]